MALGTSSLANNCDGVPNPTKQVTRGGRTVIVYESFSKVNRAGFDWITHHLRTHRQDILKCKAHLEAGALDDTSAAAARRDTRTKASFNPSYQTFEKLPLYWIADFFVSVLGMDKGLVDRIEAHKGHQLREMLEFVCGVSETVRWDTHLKEKTFLVRFLEQMATSLGSRHKQLGDIVDEETGKIDWLRGGPFRYDFDMSAAPPRLQTITPLIGDPLDMQKATFNAGVCITCPWSDLRARLVGEDEHEPLVSSFFPKDAAFRQPLTATVFAKKVAELAKERDAEIKKRKIGEQDICVTSKQRRSDDMKTRSAARTPPSKVRTPLVIVGSSPGSVVLKNDATS